MKKIAEKELTSGSRTHWTPNLLAKHLLLLIAFATSTSLLFSPQPSPWERYGNVGYLLLFLRVLPLTSLPFCLMNFLGILTIPLHLPRISFESTVKGIAAPFLNFRVVTRGLFPDLVAKNVERNLKTCYDLGLEHFQIEVVTDRPIDLNSQRNVREIVVPEEFSPPNGCKFKARALQYCLEPSVNILSDEDWIIHLDEETILTADSVKGVFNFAARGEFHFGQGIITYSNLGIESLPLTLADCIRVAVDYGLIRFQFSNFHLPLFSMKGSFVVANAGAERQVGWDHGPEGSIAEDAFFALIAMGKGFKFGFIPAEMWESSAFTFTDYYKQRKRWLEGLRLLFLSNRVPNFVKPGITFNMIAWSVMPFTTLGVIVIIIYPFPIVWIDFLCCVITVNFIMMAILGTALSFTPRRIGWPKYLGYILLTLPCLLLVAVGENAAAISCLIKRTTSFDIVQKEKDKISPAPNSKQRRLELV